LRNSAKSLPTLFHNFRTMNTKTSCNYVEIQSHRNDKILSKKTRARQANADCFQQGAANPISRSAPEPTLANPTEPNSNG
jgi:hypothetical protein